MLFLFSEVMNLEKNGFCKLKLLEPSHLESLQKVYTSFLAKTGGLGEGMSVSHNKGSVEENFLLSEAYKLNKFRLYSQILLL